jgi:aspartate racemase
MKGLHNEQEKVIGIVGGMGPEAGLMLFNRILAHTKAGTDQEHLSVLLMSFPGHIVDRTMFLEGATTINPAHNVVKIIEKLEHAGAKVIGMACNTIHAPRIFDVISEELYKMNSRSTLLHMPLETCLYLKENYPGIRRVGVLATNGTYKTGLYTTMLQHYGYEVVLPDFDFQQNVIHNMIYNQEFGLKANTNCITPQTGLLMDASISYFIREKAQAIILGCTELPLVLAGRKVAYDIPVINSTDVLALALIREATSPVKQHYRFQTINE